MNARAVLVLTSGLAAALAPAAEPVLSADRPDGLYATGDRAVFTVRGEAALGAVRIWIDDGGTSVVAQTACDFAATNACELTATRMTPGALRLRVAGPKCGARLFGVLFDWERIRPAAPCPDDFDAYWAGERARLAASVPLDPQMERVPSRDTPERLFYRLSFATFGGKRVHGAMTVPREGRGPFPVRFHCPGAGPGKTEPLPPASDKAISEPLTPKGAIGVVMNVNDFPVQATAAEQRRRYEAWAGALTEKYGVSTYLNAGFAEGRDAVVFHDPVLGILRALDWLAEQPFADAAHFTYYGSSQGAALGYYLTALWGRFERTMLNVPAMGDLLAGRIGRAAGGLDPVGGNPVSARAAVEASAPYYDTANFAPRIKTPTLVAIGLADDICPFVSAVSSYNLLGTSDRRVVFIPGMGHDYAAPRAPEFNAWLDGRVPAPPKVRRVFREARHVRGNTGLVRLQPMDMASWHAPREDPGPGPVFLRFRREFEVMEGDGTLVFDVTADERFTLRLDGAFVARGPDRGSVENWMYQTYAVDLEPGHHVFEATVQHLGDRAPLAQLSAGRRGVFAFKADGVYDARLTTGRVKWPCGFVRGTRPSGFPQAAFGIGAEWEVSGCGFDSAEPERWLEPFAVRGFTAAAPDETVGLRAPDWILYPSQLPDQTNDRIRPGRVVAVAHPAQDGAAHVFTAAEAEATVDLSRPLAVPAHAHLALAWNLGDYFCAYPELTVSGGRGARLKLAWAEGTVRADTGLKGHEDGARDAIVGRRIEGVTDTFLPDGRARAVFTLPWFRCGKWCRLEIETGDEPLTVEDVVLCETRYPLEDEGAFVAPDDPSLRDVRRLSRRAMQMCSHETLFDCPYFEQQMYPGDTRVQLNVLSALSRDDRLIRRAIEIFDLARRDDGMVPFNFPTRLTQEGATYTLCHLLMYGDYVRHHDDRAWLKARLPGFRQELSAFELYENADGLIENLPGWCFVDWVREWKVGVPPGGHAGEGPSAIANGFYLLALAAGAEVERALGNEGPARHLEAKAGRLRRAMRAAFFVPSRGCFSDSSAGRGFSEHAQCLALLGEVVTGAEAETVFRHLTEDADLSRCTVYFSFYLFETYFKFGRGDLFLKRLDLWRDYVRKGLCTTQEAPDSGADGQVEARSDCHAWGAHPIWFMQTGLAGIRPAAPFFARVRVAPCPGGLKALRARHPHPQGFVDVDLAFADGRATGTVETPVPGEFVFGGVRVPLDAGRNVLPPCGEGGRR